jgi:hypothetical protein
MDLSACPILHNIPPGVIVSVALDVIKSPQALPLHASSKPKAAQPTNRMRKTLLTIAILGLLWAGLLAWPLFDLFRLARAIENRDIATVTRHVDFLRVRNSLTQQIVDAYAKRTGARVNARTQGIAFTIADPLVARIITPEALAELLRAGWPVTIVPERVRDTAGISVAGLGTILDIFSHSEYGIGRFEITVPVRIPAERAFGLEMRLTQWTWRLANVRLPEQVSTILAEEIAKSTRTLPPAQ